MIMNIIDIACIVFTEFGVFGVAIKDSKAAWYCYMVASILGTIFFLFPLNQRIIIWVSFIIGNTLGIRRKRKEEAKKRTRKGL